MAPAINDDRGQPLKMVLKRPWYRHTIFASMPVKTLLVEVYPSVHVNPALVIDSSLELRVADAKGQIHASASVSNPGLTFLIRGQIDVADLSPGHYQITARLLDSGGHIIEALGHACIDAHQLHKLPPAPHEVVFDRHGICHVDGKPFFPIGIYHIWPGVLAHMNGVRQDKSLEPLSWEGWFGKLRDAGFNSFQDWQGGREADALKARYDIAERMGFKGQVHPATADDRDVRTLSDHGGVLGWYTFDEPMLNGRTGGDLSLRYEQIKAIDPYRPQFVCDNQLRSLEVIAPFADVVMHDFYPQRGGDIRIVGRATLHARKLKGGSAPVWPVIQAFQISRYATRADGEPYAFGRLTETEMRCAVFDAVACGATGIYYYAYYTSEGPQELPGGGTRSSYIVDDFPDQWQAMTRINGELARIVPAIVAGMTIATSVEPPDSDVHAATFVHDGRALLVVANPSRLEQVVQVGVAGAGGAGRSLFGHRAAIARHGQITLTLGPLEADALVFDLR